MLVILLWQDVSCDHFQKVCLKMIFLYLINAKGILLEMSTYNSSGNATGHLVLWPKKPPTITSPTFQRRSHMVSANEELETYCIQGSRGIVLTPRRNIDVVSEASVYHHVNIPQLGVIPSTSLVLLMTWRHYRYYMNSNYPLAVYSTLLTVNWFESWPFKNSRGHLNFCSLLFYYF